VIEYPELWTELWTEVLRKVDRADFLMICGDANSDTSTPELPCSETGISRMIERIVRSGNMFYPIVNIQKVQKPRNPFFPPSQPQG